jgi:hypothetical protein
MISILVQNIMTATDWRRLIFECKRDQSHLVIVPDQDCHDSRFRTLYHLFKMA